MKRSELSNTLSNTAIDPSIQEENLKSNLKILNVCLRDIGLKLQQDTTRKEGTSIVIQDVTKLDLQSGLDPSTAMKAMDIGHINASDSLGYEVQLRNDQDDIAGCILGEPNIHSIKSECEDIQENIVLQDNKDDVSSRPRKRQRRALKVEVFVPTMDLLRRERHLKAKEDYKKLDKMRNPRVKKNEYMVLHPDTLRARLNVISTGLDLYPILLDKGTQDVMVSRDFMAAEYGGSMQATRPNIGKRLLAKHGMSDFMYLHPDYQPVAPQVPGAHGLFLTTVTAIGDHWDSLQRVFTRIESNVWQYMGMYRLTPSPSLTKQEWADQSPKVQNTWGREICRQLWGWNLRARVFTRKRLGREPTKKEFEDLYEEGGKLHSVTPEDVMAALTKGEETLGIWLMECVGYDSAFQLELCEKFPLWVPAPRKPRGSKSKGRKSRGKGPAVRTGRKRKREENPDSDIDLNPKNEYKSEVEAGSWNEEPEVDELSGHEDDIEEVLTYDSRGTRSRPIYL